jgi:hypothetical protein
MRTIVLFVLLSFILSSAAVQAKIPKKFRGEYRCDVPAYNIEHDGNTIQVESTTAALTVSKTNAILRLGKSSFSSGLHRSKSSKSQYEAEFDTPFGKCIITFSSKPRSLTIDLQLFKNCVFLKN